MRNSSLESSRYHATGNQRCTLAAPDHNTRYENYIWMLLYAYDIWQPYCCQL